MSVNFGAWMRNVTPINAQRRAEIAWSRILRNPTSVSFTRGSVITDDAPITGPTTLPAQIVRVEKDNRPRETRGETGEGIQLQCVVYGVKGHLSDEVPDTDIERGDTFDLEGDHYVVDYVNLVPGGVQAVCVLMGIGT